MLGKYHLLVIYAVTLDGHKKTWHIRTYTNLVKTFSGGRQPLSKINEVYLHDSLPHVKMGVYLRYIYT